LCRQERIWSIFAKERGLNRKAGPLVHDDLVDRQFCAHDRNQIWLTDTPNTADNGRRSIERAGWKEPVSATWVAVSRARAVKWVVVATEEALARGLDGVSKYWIEPVEAMAEAAAVLCDCPSERTGLVRIRRPRSEVTTDSRHLSPRSFRNARRRTATRWPCRTRVQAYVVGRGRHGTE
jgi:hypothetical protein